VNVGDGCISIHETFKKKPQKICIKLNSKPGKYSLDTSKLPANGTKYLYMLLIYPPRISKGFLNIGSPVIETKSPEIVKIEVCDIVSEKESLKSDIINLDKKHTGNGAIQLRKRNEGSALPQERDQKDYTDNEEKIQTKHNKQTQGDKCIRITKKIIMSMLYTILFMICCNAYMAFYT